MEKDKKNKKGPKGNVFKVAGAKSLKKTKSKAVNLGLKNMKQKVAEIDKQLLDIKKTAKPVEVKKKEIKIQFIKSGGHITKEEVLKTADQIVKMDL